MSTILPAVWLSTGCSCAPAGRSTVCRAGRIPAQRTGGHIKRSELIRRRASQRTPMSMARRVDHVTPAFDGTRDDDLRRRGGSAVGQAGAGGERSPKPARRWSCSTRSGQASVTTPSRPTWPVAKASDRATRRLGRRDLVHAVRRLIVGAHGRRARSARSPRPAPTRCRRSRRDLASTIWRGSKLVHTAYSVPPPVVLGGPDRGSTNRSTRWFILNLPWMDFGTREGQAAVRRLGELDCGVVRRRAGEQRVTEVDVTAAAALSLAAGLRLVRVPDHRRQVGEPPVGGGRRRFERLSRTRRRSVSAASTRR